jgi:3-methylcrotonyl-CoA carboxylase alpha subunit
MFNKVLIANRGEIACRVAATCARLAIKTVAVYSDADARAQHVAMCDEAVHIGGSAAQNSYLCWEKIIAAAHATGAQAIHPGYGFLSENQHFATACEAAGLVFIGPPASAILAMGLKAESKRLMEKAGVPLVPGYHGANQDPALLQREADRIGYPVLIKASAGGGGKGMRVVEQAADFVAALASCQREARNSFGNDAVLLEKYVQRPRHIEMQIFGDSHGNYVHLLERDCSVQRRHQKVLEEAPAPGMTAELRARMGQAAVDAARAVHYVGAGTVEFIVEQADGYGLAGATYYFMEMNTRLQVEHPVTEAITGLDLVEWQLRVASGEALPLFQDDICLQGHAIEARICAENPDNNFLPATGTLDVFELPPHTPFARAPQGVRVDSGVRQGDAISPYYDPMVAKLIVHGSNRAEALARMDKALAQTYMMGIEVNVQFLRHVIGSESFVQARLDTALIQREAAVLFHQDKVGLGWAVAGLVAHTLQTEQALALPPSPQPSPPHPPTDWQDPWAQRDGWRSHGMYTRRFEVEYAAQRHTARLRYSRDGLQLAVEDGFEDFAWEPQGTGLLVKLQNQQNWLKICQKSTLAGVFIAYGATKIIAIDTLSHAGDAPEESGRLTAPMPGKVVSFAVKVGDRVKKGQALAVMEAMKMEHTIAAPEDGDVLELLFAPGDQVTEGVELLRMVSCG